LRHAASIRSRIKVRIFGFSDFHGNMESAKRASHLISLGRPDLVVIAGDLANRNRGLSERILEELSKSARKVFFVPGNMDEPSLVNWRDTENVSCIHSKAVAHNGILFVGLGGSVISLFNTPFEFTESDASRVLTQYANLSRSERLVLVSHCPPKDTKLDLAGGMRHVGSGAVRSFIEERKPMFAICGHIHEARGVDWVGEVPVVNVGPAAHGRYARIHSDGPVKIGLQEF